MDLSVSIVSIFMLYASRVTDIVLKRVRTPWYWPKFLFNTIGPGKQHDHCLKFMHDFTEKVDFSYHISSAIRLGSFSHQRSQISAVDALFFPHYLFLNNPENLDPSFYMCNRWITENLII